MDEGHREDQRGDSELVALARQGDKGAFGQLIGRYEATARAAASRMIFQSDVVHELVQEALLQAYLSLDQLRDGERFRSWLYGIVLNLCRTYLRQRRLPLCSLESVTGGMAFEAHPFALSEPGPEELAESRELAQRLFAAIATLSPPNRAATLLFYYAELSIPEVATHLGISVGTVKGRLHKSRQALRAALIAWAGPEQADIPSPRAASSVTASLPPHPTRRHGMVPVTVVDVIKHQDNHFVVILREAAGQRVLPIWVGPPEGLAIALGLSPNLSLPRPMTFTFLARLLEAVEAQVVAVRVAALRQETFYATVQLEANGRQHEVDARPSDAIALAIRTGSTILVDPEVLALAGLELPEAYHDQTVGGKGIQAIVSEWEAGLAAAQAIIGTQDEEARQQSQQALIDALLA